MRPNDEIERLITMRSQDPHRVLGAHLEGKEAVVRVFRPEADTVTLLVDGGEAKRLPMRHLGGGIFEGHLNGEATRPYQLEIHYPNGTTFTVQDPYRFSPTLGEMDLYLLREGRHERLWDKLGAHLMTVDGVKGTAFAVWAPAASGVSVVGDFNSWDGRLHPMRSIGGSGIWELFIPGVEEGACYKFEIRPHHGPTFLKADPLAFRSELPPATGSVVHGLGAYGWTDKAWMEARGKLEDKPVSIYEVHLASWRRKVEQGGRALTYRELAEELSDYVTEMGFTHVELMPVAEHPYGGSWGYQVGSYYAPTARFGAPDDLRYLINHLHERGIGVIVDWVPGHFPTDAHALGRFDGTAAYEHLDSRQGYHPDWGTYVFNFGRSEVRNFLVANAFFWLEEYHVDGLRVDAVASMLYLDYSRKEGQWVPNRWGGRENEEAIAFMRETNSRVREKYPGTIMIAEESTAWPRVSAPAAEGGLGYHFKWNMGWMHDTLEYFSQDPIYRRYHHNKMTFGMLYAYSEHFILPLSHDEVVHGKGSLYGRMPGDPWQKRANLRALFAWMWAFPGKKLLFMGGEIGQRAEWHHEQSLDWHLLEEPGHKGIQKLVAELNRHYRASPSLFERDNTPPGFQWLQADSRDVNVYAFIRWSKVGTPLVCVANLSPVVRSYRVGLPAGFSYAELLNTDLPEFGGSGQKNASVVVEDRPWDGQACSAELTLPPLGVLWLSAQRAEAASAST
jgi:1,4-alpha-glucan branching enzyme